MKFLKQWFIPHEQNNHRPHLTRHHGLLSFLIFIATVQTSLNFFVSSPTESPVVLGFATSIYQQELIEFTNAERAQGGLSVLQHNTTLDQAAEMKAEHMFAHNYWAHVAPDGTDPWHWFKVAGYNYTSAGENLARGFDTSKGVVTAWMASPTHKDNIMHTTFTQIGIAIVNGVMDGEETTLIVQLFGTPASTQQLAINQTQPSTPTLAQTAPPATAIPTSRPTTIASTSQPTTQPTIAPSPTIVRTTPTQTPQAPRGSTVLGPTQHIPDPPSSQWQSTLAVLGDFTTLSVSRLFTALMLAVLVAVFVTESFILWRKGLLHKNEHKLVHAGILSLVLASILIGGSGQVL